MWIAFTNQQTHYDSAFRKRAAAIIRQVAGACIDATPLWAGEASGRAIPSIHIVFAGPRVIRRVNRETRSVDALTDVLSYPMVEMCEGRPLQRIGPEDLIPSADVGLPELFLGDILLCLERAEEQAAAYSHGIEREIAFLSAHAVLHLLGYDHEDPAKERRMRRIQRNVLDTLGYRRDT